MKKGLIFALFIFFTLPVFQLHAQSVDILWEGENYVAPFYKGLPLWSKQSEITFVAIPQGLGNPAVLNYVWSRNGTVLGTVSGIGINSLTFLDSVLSKPVTVKVEILANQDTVLAENSLTLTPALPMAYVYENNPLYGFIFHREVASAYRMPEDEVTFAGFPFFFSTPSRLSGNLLYNWGTNTGEREVRNSVTYRVPEGVSGSSAVSLELSNQGFLTQRASKNFLVQFGDENE